MKVIDIPGIEDSEFAGKIMNLINKKRAQMLPIFILPLDTGTANLNEFQAMRELYQDSTESIEIPMVFTKLSHALKNARNQLLNDGDFEEKDQEEER
jgi:hypothetical protein